MKFLGGAPRPPVAVFPQSLDHEPDVGCGPNTRLRMAEPEALGMQPDEGDGPFNEFRRQRHGIARLRVRAVHVNNLPSRAPSGKRLIGTGWAGGGFLEIAVAFGCRRLLPCLRCGLARRPARQHGRWYDVAAYSSDV